MSVVRVGQAGVGYWGSKLARNVYEARGSELRVVSDPDPTRLEAALERYPTARGVPDVEAMIAADDIDAVVLATPAATHAEHAAAALRAGKHVLVEKPLALTVAECDELCDLAEERGLTLMVGHTFMYSEPVRRLRTLVESGDLGTVLYVYGQRLNLGVIREDLNALWNFGPHDVSILLYLLQERPVRVTARQFGLVGRPLEDVAFVVIEFANGVVGHIHDSWLDPRKVRQFTVVGDRKMAVYDDTDVEAPLRLYDKGVDRIAAADDWQPGKDEDFGAFKLQVRAGDVLIPRIDQREPLRTEIEHFVECVASGERPLTDGFHGREVVAILEAAQRSAEAGGRAIDIDERSLLGT